ncbi:MAG: response regulator transcription factor [Anaerolineales bacterium]|jgi:RNA polymerase sigma factor (sigma-70 family)|nr:response regulator transcription factor [Anaerolineales bacterium]
MTPIRILLVDDQALFRESMRAFLNLQPDFQVVGEAANGEQALARAVELKPEVILMDVRMPGMDGVEATRHLRAALPGSRVIMLTTFDDDEYVFEALRHGAVGYLLKDSSAEKLFEAVRGAARGESFLHPSIAARVVEEFARMAKYRTDHPQTLLETLSPREREILHLIAAGLSNREIGTRLFITEGTVKNHVTEILDKLGVTDRTQAALKARDLGMI